MGLLHRSQHRSGVPALPPKGALYLGDPPVSAQPGRCFSSVTVRSHSPGLVLTGL